MTRPTVVVERPPTETELVAVVRRAAGAGLRVRLIGQGKGAARGGSGEILLDLSQYHRVLRVDRDGGLVTVEAGISLQTLGSVLGSWGLTMENGLRYPAESVGGAVAMGAHGTGARYGGLSSQVTSLRLVTPDATVIDCSASEEPDIFNAARVGLGALGIISMVTLRCQRGFNVRSEVTSHSLRQALARFDAWADGNDYFELSWLPGRDRARVVTANRTDEPADGGAVDRSYRWWNRRRIWPPQIEYSVGRDEAACALNRARELSAVSRATVPFPIEVSVSAGDDIPLSPAEGRPSVYIAGVAGLGGRPQWGCAHGLSTSALRALYPRWDEWQAVRDRLDPDRRFAQSSGQG